MKGKRRYLLMIFIPILLSFTLIDKTLNDKWYEIPEKVDPPFIKYSSKWIDSVLNSMTLEQKVGQLFMIDVYPNQANQSNVEKLIKEYYVGGIIYFKGHPTDVARLTNHFQSISKTPLMVAIDGEWGVGMRLDSVVVFPHQIMLGAIDDNTMIYEMGKQVANQCNSLGINIDFAPVVDINNNSLNPVIGIRSFGEDKIKVSQKGYAYAQGLQDYNILAVAKHFPGHGDTEVDSHKDLPVINASYQRLDTLELFPFKQLINAGVGGVMIGHLYIPALDNTPNLPSSLSPKVINDLLIDKLEFKGLVFTDALGMQGIAKYYPTGDLEVMAILAGVDVLLMSKDVPVAFNAIISAIKSGKISENLLNEKVRRILSAKFWMNLNNYKPIDLNSVIDNLNTPEAQYLNRKIVENALTLVKNENNLIPFKQLDNVKIAVVSIGTGNFTVFQDFLNRYAKVDKFTIKKEATIEEFNKLQQKLTGYNIVIIGIHSMKDYSVKTFGITNQTITFVNNLSLKTNVVLDIFGNPYSLKLFSNSTKIKGILVSYEDTEVSQELSAQLLFGGIPAKGHLPVTVNINYKIGSGLTTSQIRLKYSIPAELNIDYKKLWEIDTLIYYAMQQKAFPGCQVLAIKNGVVFFQKQYGYHTYGMKDSVKWDDIYDLASVTKVASTTPSLMKLYEQGMFDVNGYMNSYLPQLDTTNKKTLKVIDVLTHQARLLPYVTFFQIALNPDGTWDTRYMSAEYSEKYCVRVTDDIYTTPDVQDYLYTRIYDSNLLRRKRYKYSDLGFYLFKLVVEKQTGKTLDEFTYENFYKSLGAQSLCYNPIEKGFDKDRIPPTEYDMQLRKELVQGYVHDLGAAVLGGIGGHAGLFGNANDLAIFFQMLLDKGTYAGIKYFEPETIEKFTTPPFPGTNRRALGFDTSNGGGPACSLASNQSFGHTGFTGCMVWADPKYDFVYVFLSNRVYPSADNDKINELLVRTKVQSLFYQSFLQFAK